MQVFKRNLYFSKRSRLDSALSSLPFSHSFSLSLLSHLSLSLCQFVRVCAYMFVCITGPFLCLQPSFSHPIIPVDYVCAYVFYSRMGGKVSRFFCSYQATKSAQGPALFFTYFFMKLRRFWCLIFLDMRLLLNAFGYMCQKQFALGGRNLSGVIFCIKPWLKFYS